MKLETLIPVANWLYENSPASRVCEAQNAMLVYGEGEIEDALFDLLFTTAFKPGIPLRLIRVTRDANAARAAFLARNPDYLKYYLQDAPGAGTVRPLTIHFMDADSGWSDAFDYACVFAPRDVISRVDPARVFPPDQIDCPVEGEAKRWSARDEERYAVLRIARKVHTVYTLTWNDRYSEAEIDRDLYGGLNDPVPGDYALRSSLRLAVSIPWKMAIANAADTETLYQRLQGEDRAIEGHSVKSYLAWQEHRSWQAFMTLNGWRMPTPEEMREYLFKGGNDHRDIANKLHPCLCDLAEDDWFTDYRKSLRRTLHSLWSKAYAQQQDQYPSLDRSSLQVHHRCKEIVSSPEYGERMNALFKRLEEALLSSRAINADLHFLRLRLVENLFSRLKDNETNSYHPFERACQDFINGVQADNAGLTEIDDLYLRLRRMARVAVERNRYCDYREIDAKIIDWLPWIINDAPVDTIWKLYASQDCLENVLSAIMLRPKRLVFVCSEGPLSEEPLEIYRTALRRRGLGEVLGEPIPLSDLDLSGMDPDALARQVVDVSGAGDLQHSVVIPPTVRTVFYENGKLQDKLGAPRCARYYNRHVPISVDEMLHLNGQKVLSSSLVNDILGMERDYAPLWRLARGAHGKWRGFIGILNAAEQALRHPVYRDTGRGSLFFSAPLTEQGYGTLIANGGLRALYDLQRRDALGELSVDVEKNRISMLIYPASHARDADPFQASRRTIEAILSAGEESQFVVDNEYAKIEMPVWVYDFNRPIRLERSEEGEVAPLVEKGYLIRNEAAGGYDFKSPAVRHGLLKEGFALEAFVYYSLFLSGRFDDVRSNIVVQTGASSNGLPLQDEVDAIVMGRGGMGVISCKDTMHVSVYHIVKLFHQARSYGAVARPILICSMASSLPEEVTRACGMLGVRIIGEDLLDLEKASRDGFIREMLAALR